MTVIDDSPVPLPLAFSEQVLKGFSIVIPVYAGCAILSVMLPGKIVDGYACDRKGVPLKYKLNGLSVLVLVASMWAWPCYYQSSVSSPSHLWWWRWWLEPTAIAEAFWGCLVVSFGLGCIGSVVLYGIGSNLDDSQKEKYARCSTADQEQTPPTASEQEVKDWNSRSGAGHFFLGLEFNPRWGPLDLKMYLYVVGATYLALNVLSAAALQARIECERDVDFGSENQEDDEQQLPSISSNAMKLYVWMMGWFLLDYLWCEELHLYTYDLFAEKLGFKLFWGCFCFYPFFYCVGVWSIVGHDPASDLTPRQVFGILALFYTGWMLTRGSNLQKFWFKRELEKKQSQISNNNNNNNNTGIPPCFFGLVPQVPIRPGSKIVCSGFWGLSRHVNYLGETLQALALALPGCIVSGGSLVPLLYPLYYVALFVPRAFDDGVVCANKYGDEWDEYLERVPYKIVPWVY